MNENLCLSGGAEGADLQWGMCAGKIGHDVIHWSFQGHSSRAPSKEIVQLTQEQLNEADPLLEKTAKRIKRYTGYNLYIKNLLRRNYYQIRDTNSLYAVGKFKDNGIDGGTAWAIGMFLELCEDGLQKDQTKLYFFEQNIQKWFGWDNGWKEIQIPIRPSGIWTGIGTRALNDIGKAEIRKVMEIDMQEMKSNNFIFDVVTHTPAVGEVIYVPEHTSPTVFDTLGKRLGGWATVSRVIKGVDGHYVSIQEWAGYVEMNWEKDLLSKQYELRDKFNHQRAYLSSKG